MKKKYISLITSFLSLLVSVAFVMLAIILLVRVANGKEYTPVSDNDLWIIAVLERLKKAGFNIFFSIMGIILSLVLATYRVFMAYFYYKIYKGDENFYKARLGEIVFYSVITGFVIGACAWLSFGGKGVLPAEVQPFTLAFFIAYIFLCVLPLVELGLVFLLKICLKKQVEAVPTTNEIKEELDALADKTAEEFVATHVEENFSKEEEIEERSREEAQQPQQEEDTH